MTMKYYKPKGVSEEKMMFWVVEFLASLARFANQANRPLKNMQYLDLSTGEGRSFNYHTEDSAITGVLVVNDTELAGADTVHGRVDFLQLVGITQDEFKAIHQDRSKAVVLVENMKADNNPDLVMDFSRANSYL